MGKIIVLTETQLKKIVDSTIINEQKKGSTLTSNFFCVRNAMKINLQLDTRYKNAVTISIGGKTIILFGNSNTFYVKEGEKTFDDGNWGCVDNKTLILRGRKFSWDNSRGVNADWVENSKYVPPKKQVKYVTPKEINSIEKLKEFQDWLDTNHSGWVSKYKTLNKDIKKGYGKYGPNTKKAWDMYGKEFLSKKITPKPVQQTTSTENK
jgi:hypothetical protein